MFANSSPVRSRQTVPHPRLPAIVGRHLESAWRRPASAAGRSAVDALLTRIPATARLVLDAGCGTGESAFALARGEPACFVIGVDKSAARLAVGQRVADAGAAPPNVVLLRCDLADFWPLAVAAGMRFERQFLLYPNPWPKPDHVRRRWHAHPVLPAMLALGGAIELRTNWRVYADEFIGALGQCGWSGDCEAWTARSTLSPFERKYAASGHALWRCRMVRVTAAA
jgi:tRNA G46 methylase TrmB